MECAVFHGAHRQAKTPGGPGAGQALQLTAQYDDPQVLSEPWPTSGHGKNVSFLPRGYPNYKEMGREHAGGRQGVTMLHAAETNESANYIPFSITAAGNERVTPKAATRHAGPDRDAATRELNLGGPQLAVGFVFFLGAAQLLMWALVKLWLFEG